MHLVKIRTYYILDHFLSLGLFVCSFLQNLLQTLVDLELKGIDLFEERFLLVQLAQRKCSSLVLVVFNFFLFQFARPGKCLKNFLEVVRFVLAEYEPMETYETLNRMSFCPN